MQLCVKTVFESGFYCVNIAQHCKSISPQGWYMHLLFLIWNPLFDYQICCVRIVVNYCLVKRVEVVIRWMDICCVSVVMVFVFKVDEEERSLQNCKYVALCAIQYYLYNLKNVKNTHGEVLLLETLFHRYFSRFLNCLYKWYQIAQNITCKQLSNGYGFILTQQVKRPMKSRYLSIKTIPSNFWSCGLGN